MNENEPTMLLNETPFLIGKHSFKTEQSNEDEYDNEIILIDKEICQNGKHNTDKHINGVYHYEDDNINNNNDDDYAELHHDLSTVHEQDSQSIESEHTMNTTRLFKKKTATTPNGIIHIYHSDNSNHTIRHQKSFNDYDQNEEVIDDMDDDDINYEDQSINELDITDESVNYEPYSRSQISITLGNGNQLTDQRPNKSHASLSNTNWKVLKPNKSKEYVLAVSQRPPLPRNIQTYNRATYRTKREHSHMNGFHNNVNGSRSETIGGGNSGPFDYWTIPRNSQPHYRLRSSENKELYMPGNLFLNERSLPRSKRKGHRNVREKSEAILSGSGYNSRHHNRRNSAKLTDSVDSTNVTQHENDASNENDTEKRRSELKVYFRFSRGTLSDPFTFDYFKNKELLIQLQARCRGWITRSKSSNQRTEENAVRIIQKTASLMLDPWFRLMLALKPLIRTHRKEEELLFLRSELERYKALVRMLRFENAEYQARVANLLHLLEQMSTNVSNASAVQSLVQQISEALGKNQEFWQTLAADNKALNALAPQKPASLNEAEQAPPNPGSTMTKLKHDAEFYRDQVELLREEADEQQLRSAEHYRNQVRALSERVEQLQHILALESSKVERLSSELEEKNSTEAEGKAYVRNLELMVNQLSKQLEQRSKLLANAVENDENDDNQHDEKDAKTQALINELQNELATHRELVVKLKDYLSSHSDLSSQLDSSTQGALEMLNSPTLIGKTNMNAQQAQNFFGSSRAQSREEVNDLTPRSNTSHQLAEMKKQLVLMHKQLIESEDTVKQETENREELEAENFNLYDKISILDRQLRHIQDEYDELVKKEMMNQRALKDVQELLDDESRKCTKLEQQNKELEQQLTELREYNEPEDDLVAKEWESMKSKLRADAMFYKRSLDQLREEYDQYRIDNDPVSMQRQLTEKEEKVNLLEKEKQQWRMELDIQNVKLQNATSLLEDTELRLKMLNRERTAQMHRMTQLETERDELIRQAATITGRAAADREMAAAKLREMDELRSERDVLRKELTEVKQALAGSTAENAAERRQLQARLRETEVHNEARISDIKAELERVREELEQLQVELQTTQASEMELRSVNQHQKWKIHELEDQVIHYTSRISGLERRSIDLDAELVRAKADLSASRETASLRRATKTRMADEWLNILDFQNETEDYDDDDDDNNNGYQKEIVLLRRRSKQNVSDASDDLSRPRLRNGQSENDLLKNNSKEHTPRYPILRDSRYRSESVLPTIGRIHRKSTIYSDSNNNMKINGKNSKSTTNLKLNGLKSSNNSLQTEFEEQLETEDNIQQESKHE
ncbi:unnamed protein product [Schistosoma turkestanicum]|nr:unnamed protein product [Schistosoma turkestanicum]